MKTPVSFLFFGVLLVLPSLKAELGRSSEGSEAVTLEMYSSEDRVPEKNPSTPKPLLGVHMIGLTDRRTDTGLLTIFFMFPPILQPALPYKSYHQIFLSSGSNRKVKSTDCPKQAPQIRLRDLNELKNLNKKKDRCFSLRDFMRRDRPILAG